MDASVKLFRIDDMNSIIRIFAYNIQERIEEIDGGRHYETHHNDKNFQDDIYYYITKYRAYKTTVMSQLAVLQKMSNRLLQIMKFFKDRAKNQGLLELMVKKVDEKLNQMLGSQEVDVGQLVQFVLNLSKHGITIRKQYPVAASKVNCSNRPARENEGVTNFLVNRRKTLSITAQKPRLNINTKPCSVESALSSLYSILNVDTGVLSRWAENKERAEKECIRNNAHTIQSYRQYQKSYRGGSANVLKDHNKFPACRNNWVTRKRTAQSQRKRRNNNENISYS